MVVQADAPIAVWGSADPGERVTVTLVDKTAQTVTGANGKWRVELAPLDTTDQPQVLTIQGTNTVTIHDVLIGDVWLCSGQSNMEFGIFNVIRDQTQRNAAIDPQVRTFCVPKYAPQSPMDEMSYSKELDKDERIGYWQKDTAAGRWGGFSAVGYLFGKEIHAFTGKPVGLIASHWGATPVQDWMSLDSLKNNPATADVAADFQRRPKTMATKLYNGMIHPLVPFRIKGVLWYQGEQNGGTKNYDVLFKSMITDWRSRWGQGDFPFLFVQLAGYEGRGRDWAMVRDLQRRALELPNTAMAVGIDVGDPKNIHPQNKFTVAHRLALAAEHIAYGKDVIYQGPTFDSLRVDGRNIVIHFIHTGSGLANLPAPQMPGTPALPAPTSLQGFELAGPDGQWFAATAKIDGDDVTLRSDHVEKPTSVRYAWGPCPPCGLYNKQGLPAVPFNAAVK